MISLGGARNQSATLFRFRLQEAIPHHLRADVLQPAIPGTDFVARPKVVGADPANTEPHTLRGGSSPEGTQVVTASET